MALDAEGGYQDRGGIRITGGSAIRHSDATHRILEHVRGTKWRAEWIEPTPGLKDYVESKHLIVRWKERKAFLRDEENERRFREHNDWTGYDNDDSPVPSAVLQVFESVGDDVGFYRGVLTGQSDALSRVCASSRTASDPSRGCGGRSPCVDATC
jgi:hypothetical protein